MLPTPAAMAGGGARLPGLLNELNHIFGKAAHNLGPLVGQFGSQEAAFSAVRAAAQAAVTAQGLSGVVQGLPVQVGDLTVYVSGRIINGVLHIGTFWMRQGRMDNLRLTVLERSVLDAFLEGPGAILECLREQLDACVVMNRELTGVGFYTHVRVPDSKRCPSLRQTILSDVFADIDGLRNGAVFVLFVKDGALDMLEGASMDEPWPDPTKTVRFVIQCSDPEHRTWPPELKT